MRTALITGITGQDGQYLAEVLHGEGYKIYGLMERSEKPESRIDQLSIPVCGVS